MTAERELHAAYQDWRRLAELEGHGIRDRNWALVADCQQRLSALPARITRLTNAARDEWRRTGADLGQKKNHLRQIVSNLIEIEVQNSSVLAAAKEATRVEVDQLDVVRQNLKRVHRSYSAVGPAVWNSFS
jgi:hypothetical protein